MIMASTFNKMSPLSMAGKHQCGESALLILEFFDKRFYYVEKAFGLKTDSSSEKDTDGDDLNKKKTWNINYVRTNQLNAS